MFKKVTFSFYLIFLSINILFAGQGANDGNDYMWTNSTGDTSISYNWINAADGTGLFVGNIDDTLSNSVALPFDFDFYGELQTEIFISANGWITFADPGTTTDPYADNDSLNAGGPDSAIAVYWDQLTGASAQNANVYTKTIGTSPFRQFIVQWVLPDTTSLLEFQLILFEETNLIKLQYNRLTVPFPGDSATVGIRLTNSEFITYSYNTAISENSAVLFHSEGVTSATAAISPGTIPVNSLQEFTYTIDNILPTTDGLAKIDTASIDIPANFVGNPIVTQVELNGGIAFIQNSTLKPSDRGFATWNVNGNAIQIQTSPFEVIDSINVKFVIQSPATTSTANTFTSAAGSVLDTSATLVSVFDIDNSVDIVGGSVSYYTFSPSTAQGITAGGAGVLYTVTSYDQYDNAVSSGDSVFFTASSASAEFTEDTLAFSGSTAQTTVSDTVAGSFTVVARRFSAGQVDSTVSGTSGLISVSPAAESTLTVISDTTSIIAGSVRRVQVLVQDQYGNDISNALVLFSEIGGGSLSAGSALSDADGIAFVDYTASQSSGGIDSINVTFGAATPLTVYLNVISDNVSYYTFSPSTAQGITAGGAGVLYTVTSYDQYDNAVSSGDSVFFTASSASAEFTEDTLAFSGSTAQTTVSDTVAGSFTVVARRFSAGQVDSTVSGTSGLISVIPAAESTLTVISDTTSIIAGSVRRVQVLVQDQYGNDISNALVLFSEIGGGSLSAGSALSDADGIAFVDYTASQSSGGIDSINVTFGAAAPLTVYLNVISDNVSYYTFSPSTAQGITAGGAGVLYTVTSYDQYDNAVSSGDSVFFTASSASAEFTEDTLAFSGSTAQTTVSDTVAGSFTVVARRFSAGQVDSTVSGTSGLISVIPAAESTLTVISDTTSIIAGSVRRVQVLVQDQYGNDISNALVLFSEIGGGSLSAGSALSDADGIAFVDYTASQSSGGIDSINVTFGAAAPLTVYLNVISDNVSYYTFSPSTAQGITAGGAGVLYTVTSYDQYDNAVSSGDSVFFTASSASAEFTEDTLAFSGSTAQTTVSDTVAGSFTVVARRFSAGQVDSTVSGTSGLISVSPAAESTLTVISDTTSIIAGSVRRVQVLVQDQYGNDISNALVLFSEIGGGSLSAGSALSDADGIAFVDYTASQSSGGIDSINVTFGAATPLTVYLNVISDNVSYYTFSPSTAQGITAGGAGVLYTVTSYDQYDNAVSSGDSVFFTASSASAEFTEDTLAFSGSTAQTTVSDTVAGSFTVVARRFSAGQVDSTVSGTSGLISVSPAAESTLTVISDTTSIIAGSVRRVQVLVQDQYGNDISNALVLFSEIGGGSLSAGSALSDADGIAFVDYTASQSSGGIDSINVTFGAAAPLTVYLNVISDNVSYYTFSPSTAQGITAGGAGVLYTVTSYDQYDNAVSSGDSVFFTASSASAEFTEDTLAFSGSTAQTTVSDTVAGSFTVVARRFSAGQVDSTVSGTSGLISVSPAAESTLTVISDTTSIIAGSVRRVQVLVQDQYGNDISNALVLFSEIGGGSLSAGSALSDADGIAFVDYTASQSSGGIDSINVTFGAAAPLTVYLNVISDNVSYYTFSPSTAQGITAGGAGVLYTVTSYDQYDNAVSSGDSVFFTASSASAEFTEDTLAFSGSTAQTTVSDTVAGSFTVVARRFSAGQVDSTVSGTSGLISVSPAAESTLTVISDTTSIIAGSVRRVQVLVQDQYGNDISNALVLFSEIGGGSLSAGSALSDADGIAFVDYTASQSSGGIDSINVTFGAAAPLTVYLNVISDNVSYYTFSPSTAQGITAGGAGVLYTVTSYDQYDNAVSSGDSVFFTASSASAEFTEDTLAFSGSTAQTTVSDTLAGSFTVVARRFSAGQVDSTVSGTSGLISVSPAAESTLTVISDTTSIIAGSVRRVQVLVQDQYGNDISNALVLFSEIGGGSLSAGSALSDADGIAFVDYTASQSSGGIDSINVTFGAATPLTVYLNVISDNVSYYTFSPSTAQGITAGGAGVLYTVTSYDQYDNAVSSGDSVFFTASSASAEFTEDTLAFSGSTAQTTVSDTVAGSFTVVARRFSAGQVDSTVSGTSGLISVSPAAESTLTVISDTTSIIAGSVRRVQVLVQDQYGNDISNALVLFSEIGGGSLSAGSALSDADGIAFVDYTASQSSGGIDSINVTFGAATPLTVYLNVISDNVSYYTFSPSTAQGITAGGAGVLYTVTSYDQYDNAVSSGDSVFFTASSASAEFTEDTLAFSGSTAQTTVSDTVAGSFTVVARRFSAGQVDSTVSGTSGLISVSPAAESTLTVISDTTSIIAGSVRRVQVLVQDQYGNDISNALVLFSEIGGGSLSAGSALSDADGIAFVDYTASQSSGGIDSINVTFGAAAPLTVYLNVISDNVSYYTFSPSTAQGITAGGAGVLYTVTSYDQYDNAVSSGDSVFFTASSASAEFTEDTLAFSGSTSQTTVSDTLAGSFTVVARRFSAGQVDSTVSGTSGLISVSPAAESTLTVISDTTSIIAGSVRRVQVLVQDQYGNDISNALVLFSEIGGGSLSAGSALSDADGIAFVDYTASQSSGGIDSINVTFGAAAPLTVYLNVISDNVSYYTFSPSTAQGITAGGAGVLYTVTSYDQYDNAVSSGDSVFFTASSASAEFTEDTLAFSGSTSQTTVSDTLAGSFTVVARRFSAGQVDSTVSGTSGLISVSPAAESTLTVISDTTSIIAGSVRRVQVLVQDQYGNDISNALVLFSEIGGGSLSAGSALSDADGIAFVDYTASQSSGGIDSINVTFGAAAPLTVYLNVIDGSFSELRIQTIPGNGGAELFNISLDADDSLTVFAEGYDAFGNYIAPVLSDWAGTGVVNGNIPAGPSTSATFTAVTTGTGTITATDNAGGVIDDISGTITVTPGDTSYVLIMDAPSGNGVEITTASLSAGQVLNLYANGYDADSNFVGNIILDWSTSGTLQDSDLGSATGSSNTIYIPTSSGSGTILTTSAFADDSTGVITASVGTLSSLKIRTGINNSGVEIGDSVFYAGDAVPLYAAGYDLYGNFIGDQSVRWTVERIDGDSIGYMSILSNTDNNTFNATIVNAGRIKIDSLALGINAFSGIILIKNGTPASLLAASDTSLTGTAGDLISDSLAVRLYDSFGNVVPDSTIDWTTPTDGNLNPASDITDVLGTSRTIWTLRSSVLASMDTAFASYGFLPAVQFLASVNPSDADQISEVSGNGQIDTVASVLAAPFVVLVEDSIGNPVPDISVTFSISATPSGATGMSLTTTSGITDASGTVQTTLTLGDLVGTYTVSATNAELLGSPVTFTVTATPDAADHLLVFSGNQQSGIVGTTLTNNIFVKAEDQYNNAVAGVTINWDSTANGSYNSLGVDTTISSGIDSVSWTLRTESGMDTLYAIIDGIDTLLFTAIANNDIANNIVVVSGNNRSAVAGGIQRIEARILDQYGNNVSGESGISFSPQSRMSAFISTSDNNGLVSAVYHTPLQQDSSIARILLDAPADTAEFLVYGISYLESTLFPQAVTTGDTVNFLLQVNNPGPNAVQIDTSLSNFSINYGSFSDSANVDSPLVLAANDITNLRFKPFIIDENFENGSYTPLITLVGAANDSSLLGTFITNPGELSISPLEIIQINIPDPADTLLVSRGGSIPVIQMTVVNRSSSTLDELIPNLSFSPDDGYFETLIGGPVSIAPGATETFSFNLNIPASAATGVVIIDGSITAEIEGTAIQVEDFEAELTENFKVIDSAELTWISYSPTQVTDGQAVTFNADVQNDGIFDILLDSDSTYISFAADTFYLANNQVIAGNSVTSTLEFDPGVISVLNNTTGFLNINGQEEGNAYSVLISSDTSAGAPSISVQTPANIIFDSVVLSDDSVSQGISGESFTVQVTNTGQATAVLSSLNDISILVNDAAIAANADYTETLTSGQIFPLNITGSSSETFIYTIDVSTTADTTGTATFSSRVAYSDFNSGVSSIDTSTVNPAWKVLLGSTLDISAIAATQTEVSQGQSGLNVDVTVVNTGQISASIDTVYLDFLRNSNIQSATLPATIAGGDSSTISFTVTIDSDAATGIDSIRAIAEGTNVNTSEAVSVTSNYLDSWRVFRLSEISINAVSSTYREVNRGQQNVPVVVTVTNESDNTVLIDSLLLNNAPLSSTADTRVTAIDSLTAGQTRNYSFQSDISLTAADTILLGARFYGTDAVSGSAVVDFTAASIDTFFVGDQPTLQVDSVYASFDTFTQGQTNLDVRVSISNLGVSSIDLDSVRLDLSTADIGNPTAGNTLGYNQISPLEPSLPTLLGGTSTVVLFRLTSPASPADSGLVEIDARAYGTDVLSTLAQSDLSADALVDTVQLQTPANIIFDSVVLSDDSVSQGISGESFTVQVTNTGQATAVLSSLNDISILVNDAAIAANADYTETLTSGQIFPLNITGSSSETFIYTIDVSTTADTTGTATFSSRVAYSDFNSGVSSIDTSTVNPAWKVLLGSTLDISAIAATQTEVSQGQSGLNVDVTVVNTGQISASIDTVYLDFLRNSNIQSATLPATIAGGDSSTISFTVTIDSDAATGIDSIRAIAEGTNVNTSEAVSVTSNYLDSWRVFRLSEISINAVSSTYREVNRGQQNVPVVVTVTNESDNTVLIDSLLLNNAPLSSTADTRVTAIDSLTAGQTRNYSFQSDISLTAADTILLGARFYGTDAVSGSAVVDFTAASIDTFFVGDQPTLQVDSVYASFDTFTQGQTNLDVRVSISNLGVSSIDLDSVRLDLSTADIGNPTAGNTLGYNQISPLEPSLPTLLGGTSTVVLFRLTSPASPADSGLVEIDARAYGTDVLSTLAQSDLSADALVDTVQLQTPAIMIIDSTVALTDSVSHGQTDTITVYLTNDGQSDLQVNSFSHPEYGVLGSVLPALPFTVSAGSQISFTGIVTIGGATSTGDVSLDVSGAGIDAFSGAVVNDANAGIADSWFVSTAPNIVISSITSSDTIVTQNQFGVMVDVTVRNDGETPVNLTNLVLDPTIGLYNQTWPPFNLRIDGNDSITVQVIVDVRPNSATGIDQLYATATFDNIYSGISSQESSSVFLAWEIGANPNVNILSVITQPLNVSQGQGPVNVQVRLQNSGGVSASIQTLGLDFENGMANYAVGAISPALPFNLNPGLEQIFSFPVTITGAAQAGSDTISAVVSFISSGTLFNVSDTTLNDSWNVQIPPSVVIDSVSIDPAQVSAGQSGLIASVYIRNEFDPNRASAQIDSVNLDIELATIDRNDQFSINQNVTPTIPLLLQQGASSRFDFELDVNNSALTGNYIIDAEVGSQDINSGTVSIDAGALQTGSLFVQDSALVLVDTLWVTPDTISQDQTHGRVLVQVTNTGEAAAEISAESITFTPGLTDLDEIFLGPSTPFTLTGGETDTLIYSIVGSASYSGIVAADAQIDGTDINSETPFSSQNNNSTQFLIQTPADISWLSTSPLSTLGNENVQFIVDVTNSGEADVQLNSNTTITIGSFNIPLADTSEFTLAASATTTITFRDSLISGLTPDRNYSLTINLDGNENGTSFNETISAGSIGYGSNLLTMTSILIQGSDIRFQADTDIEVDVNISNNAGTFNIDSANTFLFLQDAGSGTPRSILNLRRSDNLTVISGDTVITFLFDLPVTAETGLWNIYARLSLDGQTVVFDSDTIGVLDQLTVLAAADVDFVAGTTVPDTAVQNQSISFQLDFENSESASLSLNPDSSYIEFIDLNTVVRRNLSGNFAIAGNDTTTLLFDNITIPATEPLGFNSLNWRLFGTLLNGDSYSNNGTVVNAFEIVQSAQLAFSNIDIIPLQARQNEEDIRINFTIQNSGASAGVIESIDFGFTNNSLPVDDDWAATTIGLFPDTIQAGQSIVYAVDFDVAADADTGIVIPAPIVNFGDIRVPGLVRTSSTIGINDQIDIVIPASVRVDSLYFANTGTTPNTPFINENQPFVLEISVTNGGDITVASGLAILQTGGSDIDTVNILNLSAGNSTTLQFTPISILNAGSRGYTVRLDQLLDDESYAVESETALDNSETVIIQQPTTLTIAGAAITAPEAALDSNITQGQQFTIVANLGRGGQSGFNSGTVQLTLPANYSFSNGSVTDFTINDQALAATWYVIANSETLNPYDTLRVNFGTVPIDDNTGNDISLGIIQQEVLIYTSPSGTINVTSIEKTAPLGNRDTISTTQQFDILAAVSLNKELQDTTAVLNLPSGAGYSILGASSRPVVAGSVSWTLVAPGNVLQSQSDFNITVSGVDLDNGQTVSTTSANLTLNLQSRADISIASTILSPVGAIDGNVSTEQDVIIQTVVTNNGQAGFDNSGSLRLEAQNGALFRDNGGLAASLIKSGFSIAAYQDTLVIPNSTGEVSITAVLRPDELPLDSNSNDTVVTRIDSVYRDFQIFNRADLSLNIDKTGAVGNTVTKATSQLFQLRATITNSGEVGIDTSAGRHYVELDTAGTGLTLLSGQLRKPYTLNVPVVWNLRNTPNEGQIIARIMVDDAVHPVDVNDNLNPFRSEAVKSDSLQIDVVSVAQLVVVSSFSDTTIQDSIIVGQNQDSIYVEARTVFDPQLSDSKTITLILPENSGYSLVEGSLIKNILPADLSPTVSWLLKAPQNATGPDDLVIIAYSQNSDTTLTQQTSDTLVIETIEQARLSMLLSIDQPDGAADGIISDGQSFRLRGIVNNRPGTSVDGGGTVQLHLDPLYFNLIDTAGIDTSIFRNYTIGQPFYWWVTTTEAAGKQSSISTIEYFDNFNKKSNGKNIKTLARFDEQAFVRAINSVVADFNNILGNDIQISVEITSVPNDSTLNSPAEVENSIVSTSVSIIPEARIEIDSIKVQPAVSTGQVFSFTVFPGEIRDNLISPLAGFILPEIFGGDTSYVPVSDSATINISVPVNYNGSPDATIGVFLIGTDENTNQVSLPSATELTDIVVQKRPDLVLRSQIIRPVSAIERALSYGQELEVQVWTELAANNTGLEYAALVGTGEISLNAAAINVDGFRLSAGQTLTKQFAFDELNQENALTWRIIAPVRDLTTNINFNISQFLIDSNSGIEVSSSKPGESVAINVRQKEITITLLNDLITSSSFVQGQENLPLIAFGISNEGITDSLYVNAIQVSFIEPGSNTLLDIDALINMFSSLKVVNYEQYLATGLTKISKVSTPQIFADVTISQSDENPFDISFNLQAKMTIDPDSSAILMLLVDFNENANSRSFRTRLTDITAYDVADSIKLALKDSDGNDWIDSPSNITTAITLSQDDENKSFFTYPNPFGRGTDIEKISQFHFYLEQPSDVKVRIFTLLGQLVWTSDLYTALGSGTYPRLIQWDGKNSKGKRVLNGTYIGTIEIKPTNGGSVKRFITKIAYIK